MADFSTERLGAPPPVSDTLTPEPRRESDRRPRRPSNATKPRPTKLPQDQSTDNTPHEVDELA
jgi:hypothetical protein